MSDHIQIGATAPRIQYTADGAQTVFPYPFPIFEAADLEVYLDAVAQSSGFTVSGAGDSAGGSVLFASAPAAGTLVTLRRNIAIARTSDFQEGGALRAKVLNDELDRLTASLQQVANDLGRSLVLSPVDPADGLVLPSLAERAGALLGFDASGLPYAFNAAAFKGERGDKGDKGDKGEDGLGIGDMRAENYLSEMAGHEAAARTNLGLAAVASSGDYADLANAPVFSDVATSGSYNDLSDKPSGGVATESIVVFTSSGTYTPPSNLIWAEIIAIGGGSSGSSSNAAAGWSGGGGGSGGVGLGSFSKSELGDSVTITIGAGGSASGLNAWGGAGGTTTFGSLITAYGGQGAISALAGSWSAYGYWPKPGANAGSGGGVNMPGSPGAPGSPASAFSPYPSAPGGEGGPSYLGRTGLAWSVTGLSGVYGSGGSGGGAEYNGTSYGGGAGGAGVVVIREFKSA